VVEVIMTQPDLLEGAVLAGYRIVEPVGRGGMGVVYRAEEVALGGRSVAVKILSPDLSGDPELRRRFLREMRIAASIEHPNIVPIYRAGEEDGLLYIAMRYLHADDLGRVLRERGPLPPARAVRIVEQVARALDVAHRHGLVHRDVKPANILVEPAAEPGEPGGGEHVYLVDFGVAKAREVDPTLIGSGGPGQGQTGADWFVGTPLYAAPEQLRGEPVDGRADVYALGCVLFESLTGKPPYQGSSDGAVVAAHLTAPPPLASAARAGLPQALDPVIARALAKTPAERYATCGELAAAAGSDLAVAAESGPDQGPGRAPGRAPSPGGGTAADADAAPAGPCHGDRDGDRAGADARAVALPVVAGAFGTAAGRPVADGGGRGRQRAHQPRRHHPRAPVPRGALGHRAAAAGHQHHAGAALPGDRLPVPGVGPARL